MPYFVIYIVVHVTLWYNMVEIIFIELSKLGDVILKPIDTMTREEQWGAFFAFGGETQYVKLIDKLADARGEIKMAKELLQTISRDENERARFRSRRMFQMDMDHNLITARDEGREEGRGERVVEIINKMLDMKIPVNDIVNITGATREEIESLRKAR